MKRLLIVNTKYKNFGGEDANIIDEIKLLKNLYEVDYLEFDNNKKLKIFDVLGFVTNSNLNSNRILIRKLNNFKPDLVYVHNAWFLANLGIFKIIEKRNIELIHKIHNFRYFCTQSYLAKNHLKNNLICPACNMNKNKVGVFNKYYFESYLKSFLIIWHTRKYLKILKNTNLKILAITNFHKQFLITQGIKDTKIFLFINPIEISDKKNLKYNPESEYIVYAGRIDSSKGVLELLKAWNELNFENLKIKIIGEGEEKDKLRNRFKNVNIEFIDTIDNSEVKKVIAAARAVVTATKLYEGQPRLLCEASALAIPSIYPSFGGMDEFFPNDYFLKFEQFNYDDLKIQLEKLNNIKFLESESVKVYNYFANLLDQSLLLKLFHEIVFSKMD